MKFTTFMLKCDLIGFRLFLSGVLLIAPIFLGAHEHEINFSDSLDIDSFQKGQKQMENGDWEAALKLWRRELTQLGEKGFFDPRVGFEFIRVATEMDAESYYDEACFYYLKALTHSNPDLFEHVYLEEAQRILPLLSGQEESKFKQLIKTQNIPELLVYLTGFWHKRDPLSSTRRHERLIEHWKRIAYAREHFARRQNSPYGTDDRGSIYVRLGMPSVHRKINRSVSGFSNPFSARSVEFQLGSVFVVQIELWIYWNTGFGSPIYFAFGENSSDGKPYGYYPNVVDLIPSRGAEFAMGTVANTLRITNFQKRNMAKYAGLESLGATEGLFSQMFFNVENTVVSYGATESIPQAVTMVFPSFEQQQVREARLQKQFLPEQSQQFPSSTSLELDWRVYRFLTEQGTTRMVLTSQLPVIKLFDKENALLGSLGINTERLEIETTIQRFDQSWKLLGQQQKRYTAQEKDGGFFLSYGFDFEHLGDRMIFNQEVYNPQRLALLPDSLAPYDKQLKLLIGSTHGIEIERPEPLNQHGFEVSDVMLGHLQPVDLERNIPFVPVVSNTFAQGDELLVYFELYKVPSAAYQLEYYLRRKRILGFENDGTKVNLRYQSIDGIDKQYFSYSLKHFEPGDYEIVLRFTPQGEGDEPSIERIVPLTISN